MSYPRLLVLSNNSFSKSNSNGRTLGSLLQDWPKDRIAQFCISTDGPDYDVCSNYYCVTDSDVLGSTLKLRPAQRRSLYNGVKINANYVDGKKKYRKTALKMLARNIFWNLGLWRGKEFWNWVKDFDPEIVLLQSGDSFFMHDLARKVANKTKAKLAVFNTEAPFLFKKDYFRPDENRIIEKILFSVYQSLLKKSFRKFMRNTSFAVYGHEALRKDYNKEIQKHCPSAVIYTGSSVVPSDNNRIDVESPRFSYLGNMGFYRPRALAAVGRVLQSISSEFYIDVYGAPQSTANEQLLRNSPGVRFHGSIGYDEVKKIISESDVLFHVEYDSEQYAESLKYGFSTKIADSISSGKLFILFAPEYIAGSQYIKQSGAGIYAATEKELEDNIRRLLNDDNYRQEVLARCRQIAKNNHDFCRNRDTMHDILKKL